jgi:hypothetical protein
MHHMSPQYTVDRAHFVNSSERLCTLAEQCSDSSTTSYLQLLQLRSAIAALADMRVTAGDFEHSGATRCLTALKKTHWDSTVSTAAGTVVSRWKKLYQASLNTTATTSSSTTDATAKLNSSTSSATNGHSSNSSTSRDQGVTESVVPEKPALITLALWDTLCAVYNTAQLQAIWSAAASAKEKARYRSDSFSSSNGNVQQLEEDSVNGGSLSCLCGPPGMHYIYSIA